MRFAGRACALRGPVLRAGKDRRLGSGKGIGFLEPTPQTIGVHPEPGDVDVQLGGASETNMQAHAAGPGCHWPVGTGVGTGASKPSTHSRAHADRPSRTGPSAWPLAVSW